MQFFRIVFLTLLATLPAVGHSTPYYYTFSGYVTDYEDDAGIIADTLDMSTLIGRAVEFVYLIDFGAKGKVTNSTGDVVVLEDWSNETVSMSYFYAQGISGSLIEAKDGGYYNTVPGLITQADIQYGYNIADERTITGAVGSGSDDDVFAVSLDGLAVQDWTIGQVVEGLDFANDSEGMASLIYSSLTLTSITPVPIPAALWLFGSAVLVLGSLKRCTCARR
ncbi:hypothetical protein E4634_18875 [Mangrovimicrobium sediminis]|uniref:VPLPA-CTERM sorting domain-containing protein n=1 Tax=Mangrovimicrobium sediminis TaxID=2562682 RepID=A0A4Z0LVY1_9GAMM|nr:hypothetical protein [Haliea sp. SAOS-164]TGD71337.1 hypothetical protein E4634_18875 [Haliea sp. SAOS-164]